ncbi:MAG TPA: alanine--glyoxylate aminotransferase family protein [Patescibacteria group bacterium]|nr:alanine--glyoxylate aminotransferase family protein [Patescibacteria group bacterium]
MERRQFMQIPGPTNIPDRILRSLSQPIINHRGLEFEALVEECIKGLKEIYRTNNDILIFPSSGSGVLESAIVNLFSPGDTIVAVSLGVFSERMAAIAENYGLNVIRISKEWGQAVKAEEIRAVLEKDINRVIKGVCLPQNETTSAITNDIEGVSKVIKELGHPAALIVDAVSSLACLPFETDSWNVDVVISASQKGLMLPPGMGIAAVSNKAWSLIASSKMPRWYWDYKAVKEKMKENQFPYTPATTLLFGLKESVKMILDEGIENVWLRHETMGTAVRNAVMAMGLTLFAEEGHQSNTVTAILMPENIKYKDLAELLRSKYGVVIGGGLSKLQGKIFRVGHLGSISNMDTYAVMGAVEMALYELGYKVELGTAAKAVAETLLK